jgi:hypothetical protein
LATETEQEDCFQNNVDQSTFWMILLSSFFFLVCGLLNCCVPRPDPCLQNRGASHDAEKDAEVYNNNHQHPNQDVEPHEPIEISTTNNNYVETY